MADLKKSNIRILFAALAIAAGICCAVYAVLFLTSSKPSLHILRSITAERKAEIAAAAGIDAEHKIVYAERWSGKTSALIMWMEDDSGNVFERGRLEANFPVRKKISGYDPLSQTFVSGDYYENSEYSVFVYKNYFGEFAKVQMPLASPQEFENLDNIFLNAEKYGAGALEEYDIWRMQIDKGM